MMQGGHHTPLRGFARGFAMKAAAAAVALSLGGVAAAEEIKIGIVSFLSGQAADSFGVPGVNGAKALI